MFGFGKKKKPEDDNDKSKKSKIDKLIMGAIIGGAIGSVVGMSIAPKKGKDTREFLAQKGKDIYEKGKEVSDKIQDELANPQKSESSKGLFSKIKEKIFHKKEEKKTAQLAKESEMKRIPHEAE